jgi:putative tryptophan/tyrosine transport system substrate-binding protein
VIDRRAFIAGGVAALAVPLAIQAEPLSKVWRIGVLQALPDTPSVRYMEALRLGLRERGYVERKNIIIEHRLSRAPKDNAALLADLLQRNIDVLITWSTPALLAAKSATTTIPIVGISGDPVQTGLVASLARPGGNITGLAILTDELEVKNLQLLKEAVPKITRVAVLWNPENPVWHQALQRLNEAAPTIGVGIHAVAVRDSSELITGLRAATHEKVDALLVVREQIFSVFRDEIRRYTESRRLPAIYGQQSFIEVGGLMVYAANFPDMLRRAGIYVDRIFRGAKAGDLPIEQPTKFELVINVRTAKAIGLTIPPSLLLRADQVIE